MEIMSFVVGAAAAYLVALIYVLCLFSIGYKLYLHATEDRPMKVWLEFFYIGSVIAFSIT